MERAVFVQRTRCISCHGSELEILASGLYNEGAVAKFIASDPWGEHPAPFLAGQRWRYVVCKTCHQAFHQDVLSPEWNERRFTKWMSQDAIAEFERKLKTPARMFGRGINYTAHVLRIEHLTRECRGEVLPRVLDFGCGYGQFLSACAQFGFDAYGVDRSQARRDNGVVKILPDLYEVSSVQFHAITLFEVLEHLDDPRAILEQLSPLLVRGGILVLETPNCEGVTKIETRTDYLKIAPLEHINGFTPATLSALAERLGFERVNPPPAYVTTDLMRVARNLAKRFVRREGTQQYFRKQ